MERNERYEARLLGEHWIVLDREADEVVERYDRHAGGLACKRARTLNAEAALFKSIQEHR